MSDGLALSFAVVSTHAHALQRCPPGHKSSPPLRVCGRLQRWLNTVRQLLRFRPCRVLGNVGSTPHTLGRASSTIIASYPLLLLLFPPQMANICIFLRGCRTLGLGESIVFETVSCYLLGASCPCSPSQNILLPPLVVDFVCRHCNWQIREIQMDSATSFLYPSVHRI